MAWTREEDQLLMWRRDGEHIKFASIAAELGKRVSTVMTRYHVLRRERASGAAGFGERLGYSAASSAQIAERDALTVARTEREEQASVTGDVTALFFGDPLPGRSALDQKRATP